MTIHSFFSCKKRTLAFFLMICMIISFASCGEKNYVPEVSQNSSSYEQSIPDEIINPKGKYDFVKVPFKNKDGIIDFSDKFPVKNIVDDEPLRQELVKRMKDIEIAKRNLYSSSGNIVSKNIVEEINEYSYYCEVLPEVAKNKEELVIYFKKYFAENYFKKYKSVDEAVEKLFEGENPNFKIINNKLCALVFNGACGGYSYLYDTLLISEKNANQVKVIYLMSDMSPYFIDEASLVKSAEYGWVLEDENTGNGKYASYYPSKWAYEYLFITNASKINLILSGSDTVKIDGKNVCIQNNGAEYELIENFLTVKEMTDYFNEIFTNDVAKLYIDKYISVYYEKDGKLYRKIGAEKAKMAEFKTDNYFGELSNGENSAICSYVLNGATLQDKAIKMFCTLSDKDNGYFLKLKELKIAQELLLEKIN